MLKTRVITAVIGVIIAAVCISWGGVPFAAMAFILTFFGLSECINFARHMKIKVAVLVILPFLFLVLGAIAWENYAVASLLWAGSLLCMVVYFLSGRITVSGFSVSLFFYHYLLFGFGSLLLLRTDYFYDRIGVALGMYDLGEYIIWLLLFCTWASDTFAYFGGLRFGSYKIVPTISPNKTVEGFLSGYVGTVLTGLIYGFFVGLPIDFCVQLAAILGIVAPIGDLFVSKLKRVAGVKDSGQLLPGHGGILDRFDSLLFVAPSVFIYICMYI